MENKTTDFCKSEINSIMVDLIRIIDKVNALPAYPDQGSVSYWPPYCENFIPDLDSSSCLTSDGEEEQEVENNNSAEQSRKPDEVENTTNYNTNDANNNNSGWGNNNTVTNNEESW